MEQVNKDHSTGYQAQRDILIEPIYNNIIQPRNKSIIANVVNILASLPTSNIISSEKRVLPSEVETKMLHNNLNKCRYIIESYKCNAMDLDNAYNTLEEECPGRKDKLIWQISNCYKKELCRVVSIDKDKMESIRAKSDEILENVIEKLREKVLESSNLDADNEDVDRALNIILADAFINCIVLEKPKGLI